MSVARSASVRTFVTSKLGEQSDACEDVIRVTEGVDGVRIAASDGATTSSFSREWAQRLAEWYVQRPHVDAKTFQRILPVLCARWQTQIASRPLPWHAEEKVRAGAFAALLGVSVTPSGSWSALSIGDTCLFQVRDGLLLRSFPYESADAFAQAPMLASSVHGSNRDLAEFIRTATGELLPGDLLLVATDGLSQWLLRRKEEGAPAWDVFTGEDTERLAAIVAEERVLRTMRNDDVACGWLVT